MLSKYILISHLPPKEGEPDNSTVIQMRNQIDALTKDLNTLKSERDIEKTEKETLQAKLKQLDLEKLGEVERVTAINTDLQKQLDTALAEIGKIEPLQTRLTEVHKHIEGSYESMLNRIPDEVKRNEMRTLTFVDGDPVNSETKLLSAMKIMFGEDSLKVGEITIPGSGPTPEKKGEVKYDPKTISWKDGLTPVAELVKQREGTRL